MVHMKLLKSSELNKPVPNNSAIGIIEIIPISPNLSLSLLEIHQRKIVKILVMDTNHWVIVNGSRIGWNCRILISLESVLKVRSKTIQMSRMLTMHTGIEMMNHSIHEGGGDIRPNEKMFCGEEIGDDIPPMLEAKAIPRMRDFE